MSFYNTTGARMVCTRSMQLTVKKKAAPSMKTLDGTLTVVRNNERSTVSSRQAELDAQVPMYLGTSAAILEYVIFCHQEDSAWPLSEPSILKKRFDEIFEALKYTKALDQIKSVRKDQMQQVKVDSVQLSADKTTKERGARIRAQSDNLLERISELRTRITALDEQMAVAVNEQEALFRSGREFERIIAELGKFRHERGLLEETVKDLSSNIEEYEDSDEALREMQADYKRNMALIETRIQTIKGDRVAAQKELVDRRRDLEGAMTGEGRLRAEAEQYERQVKRRIEMINQISRTHNIRGFDMQLDDEQIRDFEHKLSQLVKQSSARLDQLRQSGRSRESELGGELQTLMTQKTQLEQQRLSARQQIRQQEVKIEDLRTTGSRDDVTDASVAQVDDEIRAIETKISEARSAMKGQDWEHGIQENRNKLIVLDSRLDEINNEIRQGQGQADTRAKLGLLQADLKKRQELLKSQLDNTRADFLQATAKDLNIKTLDLDIRSAQTSHNLAVEDAVREHDGHVKEVSRLEAQLSLTKEQTKQKRNELNAEEAKVLEVFDSLEEVETQLSGLEAELEKLTTSLHRQKFATSFYEGAQTFARNRECCQLCERSFDNDLTIDDFEQVLERKRAALPKKIKQAEADVEIVRQDMTNARDVTPAYQRAKMLQAELPTLTAKGRDEEAALKSAVEQAESSATVVQAAKDRSKALLTLERTATDILRLVRECRDLEHSIDTLQHELSDSGSIRSLDDMQNELRQGQTESRQLKKAIDQLIAERDTSKNGLQTLETKKRDLQLSQADLQARVREKAGLHLRIEECRETIKRAHEEIVNAEKELGKLDPDLQHKRGELEQLKDTNNESESRAQRDANRLIASRNSLDSAATDIKAYLSSGGASALSQSKDKVAELREKCETIEKKVEELANQTSEQERHTADVQRTERNINDNLRLRKMQGDVDRLKEQISDLEARNAEQDRERYVANSKRLKDKYSRLTTERAGLLGEIAQMDNQLQSQQRELSGEFKDADEIYRRQLIKVRTMEKANEDLERYGKALDNAIMKYHSMKMEEINRNIDLLWKGTYCGTDVDTILIRSEGEGTGASNRSYNYRVCMVKGDAELDMRGRCSAGQKVLASIIIRLALADTFGTNCGILALDEPTTNLDRENICALAKSLAAIVESRRVQRNFQLIIITHDEEFLRLVRCQDYCESYYRISRNEHQKSIIEKQRVTTIDA